MVRRSCVEVVPSFAWEGQATAKTNAKGAKEERKGYSRTAVRLYGPFVRGAILKSSQA